MSTKTKYELLKVAAPFIGAGFYVLALIAAIFCKLRFPENGVGFDISLWILGITTIAVAGFVFATDVLVDLPAPPTGTATQPLTPKQKHEVLQKRTYWLLMHVLIFTVVAILPFDSSPRLSFFTLLTILVIQLASIGAYNYDEYEAEKTKSMKSYIENGRLALPYLVAALLLVLVWQKYDGPGFFSALFTRVRSEVSVMDTARARAQKNSAPNWAALLVKDAATASPSPAEDPLAGQQNVVLHNEPAPPVRPATPPAPPVSDQPAVHPYLSASIESWKAPLDFVRGHVTEIPLSPDSYVNIKTPDDAAHVELLAEVSGSGMNLVLENGVCAQEDGEYVIRGSWHQGQNSGIYTMLVGSASASVWLYDLKGSVETCRLTIIRR